MNNKSNTEWFKQDLDKCISEKYGEGLHCNAEAIREFTQHINYGCDFKDGKCKSYKDSTYDDAPRCCCHGCASCSAYIYQHKDYNKFSPEAKEMFLKLFDEQLGFWREGKGCILPRKYRSLTCLSHNCSNIPAYSILLEALKSIMKGE